MVNGRMIDFSEEFEARSDRDKITYLKKLASSQNEALDLMQKDRDRIAGELTVMKALLSNAETALAIQRNIVQDSLTKSNEDSQETADRIHELETRVRAQDAVIEGHGA